MGEAKQIVQPPEGQSRRKQLAGYVFSSFANLLTILLLLLLVALLPQGPSDKTLNNERHIRF